MNEQDRSRWRATQVGVLLVVVVIVGCGATAQYGTFVRGHERAQYAIAADAAVKIAAAYPPETRSIRLEREADDLFGQRLATELRKKGFSLQENAASASERQLQVRYVLDAIKGTDLLRLSIYVPQRRLSRAYAQRSDRVFPDGPWCLEVQDD